MTKILRQFIDTLNEQVRYEQEGLQTETEAKRNIAIIIANFYKAKNNDHE